MGEQEKSCDLGHRAICRGVERAERAWRVMTDQGGGKRRSGTSQLHANRKGELFAFARPHTFGSIIGNVWRGYQRKRYLRCVEKKKTDSIGGSPWNTLGGNFENFTHLQIRRRACTLYSQMRVGGQEQGAE
jgi:hypothetical protein